MLSRTYGASLHGIDALKVAVEVDIASGLPELAMVGLPDGAVRESKVRVRAGLEELRLPVPAAADHHQPRTRGRQEGRVRLRSAHGHGNRGGSRRRPATPPRRLPAGGGAFPGRRRQAGPRRAAHRGRREAPGAERPDPAPRQQRRSRGGTGHRRLRRGKSCRGRELPERRAGDRAHPSRPCPAVSPTRRP